MELSAWFVDNQNTNEFVPIVGVDSMLVDVQDVRWVEFIEMDKETTNGQEKTKSIVVSSEDS